MSACDAFRRMVTPYLDGELLADDRSAFEAHAAACPGCRRSLEEERAVVSELQGSTPLFEASPHLRQRVLGVLDRGPLRAGSSARRLLPAALAAGVVVALVGVGFWLGRRPQPAPGLASEFASLAAHTHLRYARGQLPLEVASEDSEAVSRWFRGRVPFHLTLPDYPVGPGERKFYRLEGGRLVSFRDDYVAYVAYRMDGQPVSLLVSSASMVKPAGGTLVPWGALTFHVESVSGLKIITWSDKGLTYALASDVAVSGARSCLVCHGAPDDRRRIEDFPGPQGM